jgi:tRNA 2-thiouridine synthesizing protein E
MSPQENGAAAALKVDEDGFLTEPDVWNREIALLLAQEQVSEGLTDDHWKVVDYMRQYYVEFRSVPPVRKLARDTGISLRELKALFPEGLTKGACRIAGIPRHVIRPSFLYP